MKLVPYASALVTRIVYGLSALAIALPEMIQFLTPDLFPGHALLFHWIQAGGAIIGFLNHNSAVKSFPDGTPVTVKTETAVATVEVKQNIPQPSAEPAGPVTTTASVTGKETIQ